MMSAFLNHFSISICEVALKTESLTKVCAWPVSLRDLWAVALESQSRALFTRLLMWVENAGLRVRTH